jgi:hypothetical protein
MWILICIVMENISAFYTKRKKKFWGKSWVGVLNQFPSFQIITAVDLL